MKKLFIIMLMLAPMAAFAQKFGHFNSQEIIRLMPETTKMQKDLDTKKEQFTKELQSMEDELRKNFEEFQKLAPDTPDAIKNRKQQSIAEQQQKLQQFANDCEEELQKEAAEKMQAIRVKILDAVKQVGSAGDYVYIMDVTNGIPYISDKHSKEVTAEVKQKLGLQ